MMWQRARCDNQETFAKLLGLWWQVIEVVHAIDGDKVMLSLPATSTISEAEGWGNDGNVRVSQVFGDPLNVERVPILTDVTCVWYIIDSQIFHDSYLGPSINPEDATVPCLCWKTCCNCSPKVFQALVEKLEHRAKIKSHGKLVDKAPVQKFVKFQILYNCKHCKWVTSSCKVGETLEPLPPDEIISQRCKHRWVRLNDELE